jgi:hypothetical protein
MGWQERRRQEHHPRQLLGETGAEHRLADRNEGSDEEHDLPFHRAVALLGPHDAEHEQQRHRRHHADQQVDDAERGETDDTRDERHRQPPEPAPLEPHRRLGDDDEVVAPAKLRHLLARADEQQGVGEAERRERQSLAQHLRLAAHRQHEGAVGAAEVDVAQGATDEAAGRADQRFDDHLLAGGELLVAKLDVAQQLHALLLAQAQDVGHGAARHQQVAGAQDEPAQVLGDALLAAHDGERRDVVALAQRRLARALADELRGRGQAQLGQVGLEAELGGEGVGPCALGQAAWGDEQHVGEPAGEEDGAERREFEHADRLATGALDERADQQIGGGADQRQRAAEDGGVGEGDEHPARAQPQAPAEIDGERGWSWRRPPCC